MSEIKTTEALCNLVTSLGGPKLDPEELEWALDLPAGRAMLDWLIDQLQHGCIAPSISGDAYLTEGDILRATIKNIALESEELKIMQTIDILQYNSDHRMTCASPGVYVTPSVLHERATFSEEEARLFDNETQNLKRRLKQYELDSFNFGLSFYADDKSQVDVERFQEKDGKPPFTDT
ncbi:hypothetical protein CERSUDRAFT_98941 [Gelatoporia subvermispora B]|uniref:Uncharacterized protein n=1 Tax=Ceriporiopsis subvermispora (strain B) TaxID=914234 RepID=M2PBK4_CERS8|nr:hypothetical protein CERSUDRAFT_98941 [Gelatoporia subvermispora B]